MHKPLVGVVATLCMVAGCSAPQQTANSGAVAGQSAAVGAIDSPVTENEEDYETIYVPPPVGSLLGGGSVRVPKRSYAGNDENALLGSIRRLNAAAGNKDGRHFAVEAVANVTGVSARELQAQQDILQLRFGDLCAINAIARGNSNKVQEVATARNKGQSWTSLASSQGLSIATVAQTTRNAADMSAASYSNAMERAKGGQQKLKSIGIKVQPNARPNG